jgi:tRNA-specific 2-thiouridylase
VLAKQFALPVAEKPDSQDICFVPNGSYAKVIEKLRPGALDPGEIIYKDGTLLGKHNGIINYTIGQRRGIGVANDTPLYVIDIDPTTNRVIVGESEDLNSNIVNIRELNWLGNEEILKEPVNCTVKLRSMHKGIDAKIEYLGEGKARAILAEPYSGITPGQACVMYDESRLLGGGWISKRSS